MALSCNNTNDSFGNGELRCGCFPCARRDNGSEGADTCLERCQADLAGAGRCASCSASDRLCAWLEVDCGREPTIISYADGARSTNDASNCDDLSVNAHANNMQPTARTCRGSLHCWQTKLIAIYIKAGRRNYLNFRRQVRKRMFTRVSIRGFRIYIPGRRTQWLINR